MTLRQLEIFVTIVETGSFTKAADKFHIAQPSVSQQIRMLEDELSERFLFRMRNRKMYLTQAGKTLKRHADLVLRQAAILRMEISALTKEPTGEIHIGVGGGLWLTSMLAQPLAAFHSRFPKIHFDIFSGATLQVVEMLKSNNVDLGVVTLPVDAKELRKITLFAEEMLVVVRKSDRLAKKNFISPAEIGTVPLVLYDRNTNTRALLDDFFRKKRSLLISSSN